MDTILNEFFHSGCKPCFKSLLLVAKLALPKATPVSQEGLAGAVLRYFQYTGAFEGKDGFEEQDDGLITDAVHTAGIHLPCDILEERQQPNITALSSLSKRNPKSFSYL